MRHDERRLKLLERHARIATIARRQTIAQLAEINALRARHRRLAERTSALAREYHRRAGHEAGDGAALRGLLGFGAEMAALGVQSQSAGEEADAVAARLANDLAKADERLGKLDEMIFDARAQLRERRESREHSVPARLARSLQRSLQHRHRAEAEKTSSTMTASAQDIGQGNEHLSSFAFDYVKEG